MSTSASMDAKMPADDTAYGRPKTPAPSTKFTAVKNCVSGEAGGAAAAVGDVIKHTHRTSVTLYFHSCARETRA